MTATLQQNAEGLQTALAAPVGFSSTVAGQIATLHTELSASLATYVATHVSPNAADFGTAYTTADALASWALSAANDSTSSPPSPSLGPAFSTFDGTATLFNDVSTKCASAIAACAAPSNGTAPLSTLGPMITAALATVTSEWNGYLAQPTGSRIASGGVVLSVADSQTLATANLAAVVREAEALAGALGVTWTPGP